jgi:hypothetical protein
MQKAPPSPENIVHKNTSTTFQSALLDSKGKKNNCKIHKYNPVKKPKKRHCENPSKYLTPSDAPDKGKSSSLKGKKRTDGKKKDYHDTDLTYETVSTGGKSA